MRRLTANDIRDYLQETEPRPLILDVREPWEYAVCRIEGPNHRETVGMTEDVHDGRDVKSDTGCAQ